MAPRPASPTTYPSPYLGTHPLTTSIWDRRRGQQEVATADRPNERRPGMPGPKANPMKPNSRHRGTGARSGLIELPAEGCDLPIPSLPKSGNWSPEDRKLWRNIWKSPQANEYDDSFVPAVAAYVCHARAVYEGTASAWQAQEMRHLGGQLGLTPAGMLALGWVVRHEQ